MDDKLNDFFLNNDLDLHEPHSGHFDRFQRKLEQRPESSKLSWSWLSIAASVILIIGFYLGSLGNRELPNSLATIAPNMAETETFFVSTIRHELKEIEKHRSLDTETLIENALDKLEDLEDEFNRFTKEFAKHENKRFVVQNLINNYQRRLLILENLLAQLEELELPNNAKITAYEII